MPGPQAARAPKAGGGGDGGLLQEEEARQAAPAPAAALVAAAAAAAGAAAPRAAAPTLPPPLPPLFPACESSGPLPCSLASHHRILPSSPAEATSEGLREGGQTRARTEEEGEPEPP